MIEKIIEGVKIFKENLFKEQEMSLEEKLQIRKLKKALDFYIYIETKLEKHFNINNSFLQDCTETFFNDLYKEILYKEFKEKQQLENIVNGISERQERDERERDLRNKIFLLEIEKQNLLNENIKLKEWDKFIEVNEKVQRQKREEKDKQIKRLQFLNRAKAIINKSKNRKNFKDIKKLEKEFSIIENYLDYTVKIKKELEARVENLENEKRGVKTIPLIDFDQSVKEFGEDSDEEMIIEDVEIKFPDDEIDISNHEELIPYNYFNDETKTSRATNDLEKEEEISDLDLNIICKTKIEREIEEFIKNKNEEKEKIIINEISKTFILEHEEVLNILERCQLVPIEDLEKRKEEHKKYLIIKNFIEEEKQKGNTILSAVEISKKTEIHISSVIYILKLYDLKFLKTSEAKIRKEIQQFIKNKKLLKELIIVPDLIKEFNIEAEEVFLIIEELNLLDKKDIERKKELHQKYLIIKDFIERKKTENIIPNFVDIRNETKINIQTITAISIYYNLKIPKIRRHKKSETIIQNREKGFDSLREFKKINLIKINKERAENKKNEIIKLTTSPFCNEYKKKNGKWNYKKIGEKLNINHETVSKYLNQ